MKLMVVAHPDDEVIFGGSELLKGGDWKVICLTNANDKVRATEFGKVCHMLGVSYHIFSYGDSWNGFSPIELKGIEARLEEYLCRNGVEYVVTHNADGEYGHAQHKQLHNLVVGVATKYKVPIKVFTLSNTLDGELANKKIKLLSLYKHETVATLECKDYVLYGSVEPLKVKSQCVQLGKSDLWYAYDKLIATLDGEEKALSGFGICPKKEWVESIGKLAECGLVHGYIQEGELRGLCYLKETSLDERSYTTSIVVSNQHRGQGIGTELKKYILKYAFEHLDAKSVYDIIDVDNVTSIKTSLNCDMKIVGVSQLRRGTHLKVIMRRDNPQWK